MKLGKREERQQEKKVSPLYQGCALATMATCHTEVEISSQYHDQCTNDPLKKAYLDKKGCVHHKS